MVGAPVKDRVRVPMAIGTLFIMVQLGGSPWCSNKGAALKNKRSPVHTQPSAPFWMPDSTVRPTAISHVM